MTPTVVFAATFVLCLTFALHYRLLRARCGNALVPIALQRALSILGHTIPAQRTFVIGDTPRDIACAHAHGARAIAVATGNYSVAELRRHAPEYCFEDLSDVPAIVRIFQD